MSDRRKCYRRNLNKSVKFNLFCLIFLCWLQNLTKISTKMLTKGVLPEIRQFSSDSAITYLTKINPHLLLKLEIRKKKFDNK